VQNWRRHGYITVNAPRLTSTAGPVKVIIAP
jgi:hypothetical protein